MTSDKDLGMHRAITRRDFLNGVAIGVGGAIAGRALPEISWLAATGITQDAPGYYPPALTGMRGSHDGSFEVSHALRDGRFRPTGQSVATGETYDLVVAGGGISGLSAAYFYRKQNPSARVLILDNHDDFGGHAKRNEFHVNSRMLLANGGTVSIESPFPYSAEARGLLTELGIEPAKFEEQHDDSKVYKGLKSAYFF